MTTTIFVVSGSTCRMFSMTAATSMLIATAVSSGVRLDRSSWKQSLPVPLKEARRGRPYGHDQIEPSTRKKRTKILCKRLFDGLVRKPGGRERCLVDVKRPLDLSVKLGPDVPSVFVPW